MRGGRPPSGAGACPLDGRASGWLALGRGTESILCPRVGARLPAACAAPGIRPHTPCDQCGGHIFIHQSRLRRRQRGLSAGDQFGWGPGLGGRRGMVAPDGAARRRPGLRQWRRSDRAGACARLPAQRETGGKARGRSPNSAYPAPPPDTVGFLPPQPVHEAIPVDYTHSHPLP